MRKPLLTSATRADHVSQISSSIFRDREVDINPIAISEGKAMALDAKIVIDPDSLHHTLRIHT
jgi:succinyl-CoA synthetase beta subunit